MTKNHYPRVTVNLKKLRSNVEQMVKRCNAIGIDVAGVIKGFTGITECSRQFADGGCKWIASSRLEQIEDAINAGIEKPMMLIRVPMLSEVDEVVRLTDYSLNSETEVLKALDKAAREQGKNHGIILMADIGDLREGFWEDEDLLQAALMVERDLPNLTLSGVGTNVGCYGSVNATHEKLMELVNKADMIEAKIGRKLDIISGGATSSFMRVMDGDMPERINMLRLGEGIVLAKDLQDLYGYDMSFMYQDAFTLEAEVIEVKVKASHPVGEIMFDAFGKKREYEDIGMRKKALLAIGKVDYAFTEDLFPRDEGVRILGASSDHTILDIEEVKRDIKVGDIMQFDLDYATIVYVTNSPNVDIVFV